MKPPSSKLLRSALLRWYARHARDLPWRRTRDPYAIFLSEIMLQQTRVETVVPYFERFMRRYPTVSKLGEAPLDDVLTAWSGLGYYRRARSLWHAAREITARYGGELPSTRDELETLPGIGPYTAGAIASVAHGREEALVDGNVSRVLARVYEISDPLGSREANAAFWARARELVRGENPGDFNQALMELGATVCIPGKPRCAECPIAAHCGARERGTVTLLPAPKKKRASPVVRYDAAVVLSRGKVLLAKRPATGPFAGLWEPPLFASPEDLPVFVSSCSNDPPVHRDAGNFRHVLTHRVMEITVGAYEVTRPKKRPSAPEPYLEARWFAEDELSNVALSRLARRSLERARECEPSGD